MPNSFIANKSTSLVDGISVEKNGQKIMDIQRYQHQPPVQQLPDHYQKYSCQTQDTPCRNICIGCLMSYFLCENQHVDMAENFFSYDLLKKLTAVVRYHQFVSYERTEKVFKILLTFVGSNQEHRNSPNLPSIITGKRVKMSCRAHILIHCCSA